MSARRDQDRALRLCIALGVAIASLAILIVGGFDPAEDFLTAKRADLLSRQPTGQVAIVEIDAKSLARIQTWPWSRRYHAGVVNQLHKAGANIIAFDVDFSAPSEPAADQMLAKALRDSAPVILPIFQQRLSDQSSNNRTLANRPAKVFDAAWVGAVNIYPDRDGVVREYPAASMIKGAIQPSIATLLADNSELGDRTFQPDWAIDARRIPRFSFVDVLDGKVPAAQIKGKRIVIGATAIELGDRFTVPRFGVVPGVVVQALAADSLLQKRAIMRSGPVPTAAAVLAIILLLGTHFLKRTRTYVAAAGLSLITLMYGPFVLQTEFPVSIDSAAVLFAAVASIAGRAAIDLRRRLIQRSLLDLDSGLPNRLALERALQAGDQPSGIVVAASIERFEIIRDAIGIVAVGDLMSNCAARIAGTVNGPISRIAPDTLAWLQADTTAPLVLSQIELVAMSLRQPIATRACPVDVLLTVGLDRDAGTSATVLRIERALAAIGHARSCGQSVSWYETAEPAGERRLSMSSELRHGMASGDVFLAYQPKLSLKRGRIGDAEALVRWRHPVDGIIPPDKFIPLAETTGVVRELTEFALRTALTDCARWNAAGLPMRVAVNISAADIATDDFLRMVDGLLETYAVPPSQLAMELTESAIIRSPAVAIAVLTGLRARGIRLSVDDYGTGQSTLSYLKQLPVHELKIDKSFVTSLCENQSDAIMVRSTIDLAHDLGLEVVAEGIEDAATLNLLTRMGCDYAQGYFVGKPMSFYELLGLARDPQAERQSA